MLLGEALFSSANVIYSPLLAFQAVDRLPSNTNGADSWEELAITDFCCREVADVTACSLPYSTTVKRSFRRMSSDEAPTITLKSPGSTTQ